MTYLFFTLYICATLIQYTVSKFKMLKFFIVFILMSVTVVFSDDNDRFRYKRLTPSISQIGDLPRTLISPFAVSKNTIYL